MRNSEFKFADEKCQMPNLKCTLQRHLERLILAGTLLFALAAAVCAQPQTPSPAPTPDFQSVIARQAALVTEFDVNGLKVLVKKREGSLTVAAGLFIRGGVQNITAENAGIEALMLDVASEASANFPRERLRIDLSRMGTVIGFDVNRDYSVLALRCTRPNFERSWQIFSDVALNPSFAKEHVALVQQRQITSRRDDIDDPDSYLQQLQDRVTYAGHPYLI